jgi:hypothetical protein
MEPIIGKKYRTTNHPSINERFRDREIIVLDIKAEHIHIRFDGDTGYRTVPKVRWDSYVRTVHVNSWHGNILKFHFS